MKRILPLIVIITALFSASTFAQFEIGASYEIRDQDPKNGFGIRIQKGILSQLPIVNLGLRLHASYFSDENSVTEGGVTYSRDLTNYDLGVAAYGGISLGLLEPYVGLGLGTENYEAAIDNYNGTENLTGDESNLFWNTFVGAKVTILPMLKPFVEYRYSNSELSKPDLADAQNGRIMFGILFSF
jgi:opacity protein-like surface antigen